MLRNKNDDIKNHSRTDFETSHADVPTRANTQKDPYKMGLTSYRQESSISPSSSQVQVTWSSSSGESINCQRLAWAIFICTSIVRVYVFNITANISALLNKPLCVVKV